MLITMLFSLALPVASAVARTLSEASHATFEYTSPNQSPLAMTPVPDNNTRVSIVLGVMSRCPDALLCESLFDSVLQQTWDIVDINLVFVGTINSSDKVYGVKCKHGPEECAGNVQELCAINRSKSQEDWWNLVQCINYEGLDSVGNQALVERCAGVVSIPWNDEETNGVIRKGMKSCVEEQEGKDLLKASVKMGNALGISKSCTIMISGKQRCVHDGAWKDCETGHTPEELVQYIRDEYERLRGSQ